MAEITLVKEVLTDQMISAGAALIETLDRENWPLAGAFWSYDPEINDWKLLLASPAVKTDGLWESLSRVREALRATPAPLPFSNVSVVPPDDEILQTLAGALLPGWENGRRRVSHSAYKGRYIEDVYVYRLPPIAPAA